MSAIILPLSACLLQTCLLSANTLRTNNPFSLFLQDQNDGTYVHTIDNSALINLAASQLSYLERDCVTRFSKRYLMSRMKFYFNKIAILLSIETICLLLVYSASTRYFYYIFTYILYCGGTGIDTIGPTNTVPNTTDTVADSGSVYTGFIRGDKRIYIQGR